MDDTAAIAELLEAAGRAHHHAFLATDGNDPEWPMWYAAYLDAPLRAHAGYAGTRSELVALLVDADRRHGSEASDQPWAEFFATVLSGA